MATRKLSTSKSPAEGNDTLAKIPDHDKPRASHHASEASHKMPEGSSQFQAVMLELHPPAQVAEVQVPRRRRRSSLQMSHEDKTTDLRSVPLVKVTEGKGGGEELQGRHILHGKCHCYVLERGNVTGLADELCRCHHRTTANRSPSPSPSPSPLASPRARHRHHHHSTLHPEEFRGRAYSDASVLDSRFPASPASPKSSTHGRRSLGLHLPQATPGNHRVQRSSSFRHVQVESLTTGQRSASPPAILVPDAGRALASRLDDDYLEGVDVPKGERKLSTSSIPSDQLHYLYEQLLPSAH